MTKEERMLLKVLALWVTEQEHEKGEKRSAIGAHMADEIR
jgi:hypothetical protein